MVNRLLSGRPLTLDDVMTPHSGISQRMLLVETLAKLGLMTAEQIKQNMGMDIDEIDIEQLINDMSELKDSDDWGWTGIQGRLDPAVSGDRVVVRMDGIHEVDRLLGRFACFEFVIALNEFALFFGIGLAGNQFRLFIDIAHTLEQLRNAAFAVRNAPRLFHIVGDFFGR